ncbi:hypothetical protein [Amycolatopsis sp. SID8362]|uniref:hypothetical protein n=1 Tax=Amycolatopsis sp. SID8362 TaxID=2690346 RepID=UPI00136FF0ED|nr:hypothetical protein [Amycolatopsis sp. SID8362]NBH04451.1 hypothetical protein [Amycolatopsis sp. SID8362]NED41150.1 hypothetical protein [Amycolatopsis sp. SID8362]
MNDATDLSEVDVSHISVEDIESIVVDCDRCVVRGISCHDCVISVLLGAPPAVVWDADERRAVDALAEAGMVPRLRLVEGAALRSA